MVGEVDALEIEAQQPLTEPGHGTELAVFAYEFLKRGVGLAKPAPLEVQCHQLGCGLHLFDALLRCRVSCRC